MVALLQAKSVFCSRYMARENARDFDLKIKVC